MTRSLSWKSVSIGCFLGVVAGLSGFYLFDAVTHLEELSTPSVAADPRPLKPVKVDASWVKSGNPNFRLSWYARTRRTGTGIWQCDGPTTFEWTFNGDEQIYILEGGVDIEYLGKRFSLKPGDTALFLSGTKAIWHVPVSVKKSFTLHQPNLAVRWYRRMFGIA